ncbi:hypothetical protein K435DRAFT_666333, partial [Dendrothele bispora CBS 962.96]
LTFQALLTEMISNFEFSLTKECEKLRREACLAMLPAIAGELDKGPQMFLKVSIAEREE